LLNFQFEPRGNRGSNHHRHHQPDYSGNGGRNNNGRGGKNKRGKDNAGGFAVRAKYNKEQYLQANCQFVVRSGPDYSAHLSDPDLVVDWDLIEQVVLKTSAKVPSCPICLSPPVAAKITRCGHVYCWTCMLHYLSLSDDEHRKCPICFEEVANKDLKSVVSVPWREFKIGEEIELTLMRRERHSLFALPVDQFSPDLLGKHPNIGQESTAHSPLLTAHPQQVTRMILSREQQELLGLMEELKGDPTLCYVEQALVQLTERESNLALHAINIDQVRPDIPEGASIERSDDVIVPAADSCDVIVPEEDKEAVTSARPRRESSSSEASEGVVEFDVDEDETTVTAKDLDFSMAGESKTNVATSPTTAAEVGGGAKSKRGSAAPKETFYFYQSSDKQPIFLHAMNVEMLISEHGSFEKCPLKISGKILEKDSASMTFELRDKLRYLAHVPVTCAFEVVELELNDQVSKEVAAKFAPQLEARRLKRSKRARDERRREKRIQVEESKIMGSYRSSARAKKSLKLESDLHFPGISGFGVGEGEEGVAAEGGAAYARRISESSGVSIDSNSGGLMGGGAATGQRQPETPGASFAKMLRQGGGGPRSIANTAKPMSRSEAFPAMAAMLAPPPLPRRVRQASESSEGPGEDYVPPPPTQSIGDALANALQRASIAEDAGASDVTGNGSGSGKKKAKKTKGKKIDLFCSARPIL